MLLNEDYFNDIEITDDDIKTSDEIITAGKKYNSPK